jgi:hypothetical protein
MVWVKGELLDDLDRAEAAAGGMLDRAQQSGLFDRLDWFKRVWRHTPPGEAPLIARALSEGTHGWLFLSLTGEGRATALANWYSLAFRPVFHGNGDETHRASLLVAMARRLRPGLSQISLSPVPRNDGTSDMIVRAFRRAGWHAISAQATTRWSIDVSGLTFDEYWAARPGQLRSTYSRKCVKAPIDVTIYDRFDEAAWADYEAVYADSWKPEEGSPNFLRDMAHREGASGILRLCVGRIEGEAVAAQLWTVENGIAVIHKLAHRERVAEFSPGTLLTHALFKHVIDQDHVDIVDFGTGNDSYKADWMDSSEPLDRIELFNPASVRGLAGIAKAKLSALVRSNNNA